MDDVLYGLGNSWVMTDVVFPVTGWAIAGFLLPIPIVVICFFSQQQLAKYATLSEQYYSFETFLLGPRPVALDIGRCTLHHSKSLI